MVQKVYQRHNIAQHDMGYRKIDKDLIDHAKSDLLKELPQLFKKCDSDWFADWALSRRHKTRNTKKTKKTDTTEQPLSDDEAAAAAAAAASASAAAAVPEIVETQLLPSGAGESSSKSSEARGLFVFLLQFFFFQNTRKKHLVFMDTLNCSQCRRHLDRGNNSRAPTKLLRKEREQKKKKKKVR